MLNSGSSIPPSFNKLDMLVSNTADANVAMSVNFVTFTTFFCYFSVSAVATPLTLAPARDIAPKGMLMGRLINILNVATLHIPEATLRPLVQALAMSVDLRPHSIPLFSSHTFLLALPKQRLSLSLNHV